MPLTDPAISDFNDVMISEDSGSEIELSQYSDSSLSSSERVGESPVPREVQQLHKETRSDEADHEIITIASSSSDEDDDMGPNRPISEAKKSSNKPAKKDSEAVGDVATSSGSGSNAQTKCYLTRNKAMSQSSTDRDDDPGIPFDLSVPISVPTKWQWQWKVSANKVPVDAMPSSCSWSSPSGASPSSDVGIYEEQSDSLLGTVSPPREGQTSAKKKTERFDRPFSVIQETRSDEADHEIITIASSSSDEDGDMGPNLPISGTQASFQPTLHPNAAVPLAPCPEPELAMVHHFLYCHLYPVLSMPRPTDPAEIEQWVQNIAHLRKDLEHLPDTIPSEMLETFERQLHMENCCKPREDPTKDDSSGNGGAGANTSTT